MKHRCFEPGELAELSALPPSDPRRRAADQCARCDALLRAQSMFLAGDPDLQTAECMAAEAHLAGVIAAAAAGRPVASSVIRLPRARRRAGWGWGLGLAAALAGVALFSARDTGLPAGPNGRLRGGIPAADAAVDLAVAVAPAGGDSVRIGWPAVAGADHYQLELFTGDLDTLAVLGPLDRPSAAVAVTVFAAEPDKKSAGVLCRVRASGPSGQVAVSRLAELHIP